MAQPPEHNEAFLREVDEELSYDRLIGFFRDYGRMVLAGIVVGLAAFAGYLWWQSHQTHVAGLQGEQLSQAIKDLGAGNQGGVPAKLDELSKNGTAGYRASAKLLSAALAQEKGDTKTAVAGFSALAEDTSVAQPWRDVALVRQTALEYDTLAPDVVVARLAPLAVKGKPWFGTAGEMVGMAYVKQGKTDLAGKLFADLAKDKTVPETIAARARQMASSLGADVASDTPAPKP